MTMRPAVKHLLNDGLAQHQAGKPAAAAACYRQILNREPQHTDALHLLGIAERDQGHLQDALQQLQRVVRLRPNFAEAYGNLGLVYAELDRPSEAAQSYERAIELNPALVEPRYNLGNLRRDRGESAAALRCYEAALARRPFAAGYAACAALLLELNRHAEAATAYRAACELAPNDAALWNTLGSVLQWQRQFEAAISCHHRATQIDPNLAEAHNNLGNALKDYERPAESIVCYRRALEINPKLTAAWNNLGNACLALGRGNEAMLAFNQALRIDPAFAEAHLNLGNVLKLRGNLAEATFCFRQALALKANFVEAHNNLGVVLTEQGQHAEAIAALETALSLNVEFAEAHNNLGNVYKNQGRLEAALASFRQALALCPTYHAAHSNLLFTMNYVDGVSPQEIFDLHRDFNARHAARYAVEGKSHANTREPARRLKIGYISPDFRAHACAFFVKPIFENHSRDAVEVYAYAEVANPDAVTAELRALTDEWRSTVGLSDAQVAAMIRADEVDVLVDLAGHTANARLLALARKPAPVQVTYLGYPATTGLDVMDYRLTDGVTEPVGSSERYYTEELVRLPQCLWCYAPFADMPAVTALPALTNGYVTFGSFNNFAKIGPRVIELWAAVLRAVPNSRITLITIPAGTAQAELRDRFAALGVATERVVMHDRLLRREYLDLFSEVDIALDPFPCNGGTTTCDALWMGLPVVALTGETFLSRASYSILSAVNLTGYAAADVTAYQDICVKASRELETLARVRAQLRKQLTTSPLLAAPAFTRDLEAAYRALWQRWCACH